MSDSEDTVQCRSCLSKTASEYIHMESSMAGEYSYIECFNICTNLNANLDDGFPDFICDKCSQDLQVSFNFINEARVADAALRKNLPSPKQQIANSALDEKEYVWTMEDEANLQKEDMFEVTPLEFMDNDEEYQDLEECEDDLILEEDVKIEDEQMGQTYQLESTVQSVKDEPIDQLTQSQTYSEDEQNDEEPSKECDENDENDESVKDFEANLVNTRKGRIYRERNYTCIVCGKGYQYNINLRNHMRLMHREEFKKQIKEPEMESVRCEVCKRIFLKKNIERHMLKHSSQNENESTEPQLLLCAYCPKTFTSRSNLINHEKVHNPSRVRKYACEYCDMRFYKVQTKIDHVKYIHLNSNDRPHVCPICGKNYKARAGLSTHFKVHLSKRFECTQCDKKYPRVNELTIHMRTHTGEMPFKCHLCDQSFRIKNRLTLHLQRHLGAKHKCKICNALFDTRLKLRHHKYEHTGLPYRCDECPDAQYSRRISQDI